MYQKTNILGLDCFTKCICLFSITLISPWDKGVWSMRDGIAIPILSSQSKPRKMQMIYVCIPLKCNTRNKVRMKPFEVKKKDKNEKLWSKRPMVSKLYQSKCGGTVLHRNLLNVFHPLYSKWPMGTCDHILWIQPSEDLTELGMLEWNITNMTLLFWRTRFF